MKLNIKEKIQKLAEKTAMNSYGRSMPIMIYETKMPEAVKKAVEKSK
ncbi:MAG: exodeoxyribonuclease V subunit alpha [Lachnospiraceae bacterium]|nr:exodeoxyribonuclease V subunit alpha [Lachnospiraceae bacterium]